MRNCKKTRLVPICEEDIFNLKIVKTKLISISEPYSNLEVLSVIHVINEYERNNIALTTLKIFKTLLVLGIVINGAFCFYSFSILNYIGLSVSTIGLIFLNMKRA